MKLTLTFTRDTKNVKKPSYLKNEVFLIYAPKKLKFLLCSLKERHRNQLLGYFTSKFRSGKIETIVGNQQRIWIGILNKSLTEDIVIKKINHLDFLC